MRLKRKGLPTLTEGQRFDGYTAYDQARMLQLITRNMEIIRREQERGLRMYPGYMRDLEEQYARLLEQRQVDGRW